LVVKDAAGGIMMSREIEIELIYAIVNKSKLISSILITRETVDLSDLGREKEGNTPDQILKI